MEYYSPTKRMKSYTYRNMDRGRANMLSTLSQTQEDMDCMFAYVEA